MLQRRKGKGRILPYLPIYRGALGRVLGTIQSTSCFKVFRMPGKAGEGHVAHTNRRFPSCLARVPNVTQRQHLCLFFSKYVDSSRTWKNTILGGDTQNSDKKNKWLGRGQLSLHVPDIRPRIPPFFPRDALPGVSDGATQLSTTPSLALISVLTHLVPLQPGG